MRKGEKRQRSASRFNPDTWGPIWACEAQSRHAGWLNATHLTRGPKGGESLVKSTTETADATK